MKKLLNGLTSVENVIMVAAFAIMVICTFTQVLNRNFFKLSSLFIIRIHINFITLLCRRKQCWCCYFYAALCIIRSNGHSIVIILTSLV